MSVRKSPRAFTLVELLVVIGIIGALIGILLPVLSGVQARGRDLKCQSNLRSIMQAVLGYCAENKGSMPYGLYFAKSDTNGDWSPSDGDWSGPYVSWVSLTSKYMGNKSAGVTDGRDIPSSVLSTFRCPEAEQAFPHVCSYVMNFIVGVAPYYELVIANRPNAQMKPPLVTQMLKESAVVWDTAIQPNWERNDGFLLGADIDSQRFWQGAERPQYRYFSINDPFGQVPPGMMGNNRVVRLDVGSYRFTNEDPGANSHYPWQGNLRFRHNKRTTCNVGWADGHVSAFTAKLDQSNQKYVKSHDARRRYFMIKWPSGTRPFPGVPF